jgi:hypothetical protein
MERGQSMALYTNARRLSARPLPLASLLRRRGGSGARLPKLR